MELFWQCIEGRIWALIALVPGHSLLVEKNDIETCYIASMFGENKTGTIMLFDSYIPYCHTHGNICRHSCKNPQ